LPLADGFTFFGDLLGVSGAYRLSASVAYEKLNEFYRTTFHSLSVYCQNNPDLQVNLFSDSILIWGPDPEAILEQLSQVYVKLFHKGILLRGALVDKTLQVDPRIRLENFEKFLPTNDTLARAVGLEKTEKGARLLVAPALAECLLDGNREWLTVEGYIDNPKPQIPATSILRRICPTPSGNSYELLYYWIAADRLAHDKTDYHEARRRLKEIAEYLQPESAVHYQETVRLLHRCELRQKRTDEALAV
jgi:hypothetical protein